MSKPPKLLRRMGLQRDFRGRCRRMDHISFIIKKPDWTAVKKRATSHPEEAKVPIWVRALYDDELLDPTPELLEDCGNEPVFAFHVALVSGRHTPIDVLRTLLEANPTAATCTTLKKICELEYQYLSGECFEVILDHGDPSVFTAECLKSAICTAISSESLEALRVLMPRYISADPKNGHFPIQYACENLQKDVVLPYLFRVLIEKGAECNVGGEHGAGGLFMKVTRDEISKSDRDSDGEADEKEGTNETVLDLALKEFDYFYKPGSKIDYMDEYLLAIDICLCVAAGAKARQDNLFEYPRLHAALSLGTTNMIDWAVAKTLCECKRYGKRCVELIMEKLTEKDSLGRTPIDLALRNMHRFEDAADRAKILHLLLLARDSKLIQPQDRHECFLKMAASVTVQSARDLYECAVECGADCIIVVNILRANPSLVTHPSLVTYQDATTRLHPWMLLASMPNSDMDDIFDLLRRNPSSVESGIRPSAQEEYLVKKHLEKEANLEQEKAELKRERDSVVAENSELKAKIARLESSRCDS